MTVTDYDLKFAEVKLEASSRAWRAAQKAAENYAAELLRLQLRRLFDDHPELLRVGIESEYEYDDEGGYFQVINVFASVDEDHPSPSEFDAEEAAGEIRPWSTGAVAGVIGDDEWDGGEVWLTREDVDKWTEQTL